MSKYLRLLTAALLLSLMTLAFPAHYALAATVTLSQTDGTVGTTVTVTGTGFNADSTVNVYFISGIASVLVATDVSASDGSVSTSFDVPETYGGNHTVRVQTPTISATATFTVDQSITLSPTTARIGDRVNVSGTGWTASDTISINIGGSIVDTASTDSNGSFSSVYFNVPELSHGNYSVTVNDSDFTNSATLLVVQNVTVSPASGGIGTLVSIRGTGFRANQGISVSYAGSAVTTNPSSIITTNLGTFNATFSVPPTTSRSVQVTATDGIYSATVTFTVVVNATINPTSGKVGSTVSASGSGFTPNQTITVSFDSVIVATTTSDASGAFSTTFNVPPSFNGTHTVSISDGSYTATSTFQTQANLTVAPTSGHIKTPVTVSGTGFGSSRSVSIKFGTNDVGAVATDANGSFSTQFTVPLVTSGNYTITASDGTITLTAPFALTVSINLSDTTGHVGTQLTITGSGFSGTVTIQYDSTTVATATTDANGNFSASFTVPASIHGSHTITASDSVNKSQATFTMDSTPPPAPSLLKPANGARQNAQPALSWGAVTDPSGVTYTLQISTDSGFTNITLQKQGLTTTEYTLLPSEKLPSNSSKAPYYWRVKAVDLAQNESAWSTPGSFYVSFVPPWALYTLYALGGIILALFFFWLGRRTAGGGGY